MPQTIDRSAETQLQRKVLVERLVNAGILKEVRISEGNVPYVTAGRAFMEADFAEKQNIISIVYALYYPGTNDSDVVWVLEPLTNKTFATYSLANGGLKLE
jgi:hypothetical protein